MPYVFISYKREDHDFAAIVRFQLEKAGISVWMDNDIDAGERWSEVIHTQLKGAFAVLVIMSPEATKSEYVTYEWAFALGNGKIVLPILLEQTELHPQLGPLEYLDFRDERRNFNPLIERLSKLMEEQKSKLDESPTPLVQSAIFDNNLSSSEAIFEAIQSVYVTNDRVTTKAIINKLASDKIISPQHQKELLDADRSRKSRTN